MTNTSLSTHVLYRAGANTVESTTHRRSDGSAEESSSKWTLRVVIKGDCTPAESSTRRHLGRLDSARVLYVLSSRATGLRSSPLRVVISGNWTSVESSTRRHLGRLDFGRVLYCRHLGRLDSGRVLYVSSSRATGLLSSPLRVVISGNWTLVESSTRHHLGQLDSGRVLYVLSSRATRLRSSPLRVVISGDWTPVESSTRRHLGRLDSGRVLYASSSRATGLRLSPLRVVIRFQCVFVSRCRDTVMCHDYRLFSTAS